MKFTFPDPADFPENDAPRVEDGNLFLTWEEQEIRARQFRRVEQTRKLAEKCREPKTRPVYTDLHPQTITMLWTVFGPEIEALQQSPPAEGIKDIDRTLVRGDLEATATLQPLFPHWRVKDVTVQVSRPEDRHHYQQFADCETVTKLVNLHMDPKPGVVKAIIYLSEVGPDNGPFECIEESLDWEFDTEDRIWAWGNSVGNYLHTPQHRRAYNSLRRKFRGNAIIGRLIPDGSGMSDCLLSKLTPMIDCNCVVFDPSYTFHRGGLVREGERVNLQVRMY